MSECDVFYDSVEFCSVNLLWKLQLLCEIPKVSFCVEVFQSKISLRFHEILLRNLFLKTLLSLRKCISNGIDDRICYTRDSKINYFRKTNPLREKDVSSLSQIDPQIYIPCLIPAPVASHSRPPMGNIDGVTCFVNIEYMNASSHKWLQIQNIDHAKVQMLSIQQLTCVILNRFMK